jgi:hypothetical protein
MTLANRRLSPAGADAGVALPLAIFALVLTGSLVVALLWAGHLESRAAQHVHRAHSARLAADGVWPPILEGADSIGLLLLGPGDSAVVSWAGVPGRLVTGAVVHRLNTGLFLVEARARDAFGDAARFSVQVLAMLDSSVTPGLLRPVAVPFWSSLPRFR